VVSGLLGEENPRLQSCAIAFLVELLAFDLVVIAADRRLEFRTPEDYQ